MFGKSDTFLDGPSLSRTETCFPISNCGGALSVAQFDFSWHGGGGGGMPRTTADAREPQPCHKIHQEAVHRELLCVISELNYILYDTGVLILGSLLCSSCLTLLVQSCAASQVDYANHDFGVFVVRRYCFSEHGASGTMQEDAGNGGGANDELLREVHTTSTIQWL
jgi:hypothetical protein